MFTDASMGGWEAVWNGTVPVRGFFDAEQEGSHIYELELTAALLGLEHFVRFAKECHVQVVTDSMATHHVIQNMTSRAPRMRA